MQLAARRVVEYGCCGASTADVLKGLGAGLVGGLVGTMVMTQFQTLATQASQWKMSRVDSKKQSSGNGREAESGPEEQPEPATAKMATALATPVLHRSLTSTEKELGSTAVHYGFGMAMGGLYGAVAEAVPAATTCTGTLFGTILWLLADEVAIPLLRLGSTPLQTPAKVHVYAWASHLVYGFATDAVRRGLRARW